MDNPKLKEIFEEQGVTKGIGKENEYSYSIICNNPKLSGQGVFSMGESGNGKDKMYNYLASKNDKIVKVEDFMNEYGSDIDYSKFEGFTGIDIETGKPHKIDYIKQLHTLVGGATGSGKSVTLYFILLQLLKNKYSELYIIDKTDFGFLAGTAKVRYRGSSIQMSDDPKSFYNFIQYFWLEQDRRNKIFEKYKNLGYPVKDWASYKEHVMGKVEGAPILNYIFIVIDEYQTLRKGVADSIGETTFDNNIKKLLDTVRAAGMCFYIGTQDLHIKQLGDLRSSMRCFFFGLMSMIPPTFEIPNPNNLTSTINGTYLFYHSVANKFLKIPFSDNIAKLLVEESNNPSNRITENKLYDTTYHMLNDLLGETVSDIFEHAESFGDFFSIKPSYIESLKESSHYPSFMVLLWVLLRGIKGEMIDRSFDIFKEMVLSKEIDKLLFQYINFFKDNTNAKFLKLLQETFEASGDQEEFIEKLSDILNNYLKQLLWSTKLDFNGSKETKKEIVLSEEEIFLKSKSIIDVSYSGEIKPQSVNSMYFVDKNTDKLKRTSSTDNYEDKIKNLISQRMMSREIKQFNEKCIVDILFEIELPENKDGSISGRGRIDLDNLMKATIDSISKTAICDDNLIYGIHAQIRYKVEGDSVLTKNNKVKIRVYPFEDKIVEIFKNVILINDQYSSFDHTFSMNEGINIPSYNTMYNIIGGKKVSSANTNAYKKELKRVYSENNETSPTGKYVVVDGVISVFNDKERDLDNMLKATLDAFTGIVYNDDKQILEFFIQKEHIEGSSGRVKLNFYEVKDEKKYLLENKKED